MSSAIRSVAHWLCGRKSIDETPPVQRTREQRPSLWKTLFVGAALLTTRATARSQPPTLPLPIPYDGHDHFVTQLPLSGSAFIGRSDSNFNILSQIERGPPIRGFDLSGSFASMAMSSRGVLAGVRTNGALEIFSRDSEERCFIPQLVFSTLISNIDVEAGEMFGAVTNNGEAVFFDKDCKIAATIPATHSDNKTLSAPIVTLGPNDTVGLQGFSSSSLLEYGIYSLQQTIGAGAFVLPLYRSSEVVGAWADPGRRFIGLGQEVAMITRSASFDFLDPQQNYAIVGSLGGIGYRHASALRGTILAVVYLDEDDSRNTVLYKIISGTPRYLSHVSGFPAPFFGDNSLWNFDQAKSAITSLEGSSVTIGGYIRNTSASAPHDFTVQSYTTLGAPADTLEAHLYRSTASGPWGLTFSIVGVALLASSGAAACYFCQSRESSREPRSNDIELSSVSGDPEDSE
jgi:hypothetical protein